MKTACRLIDFINLDQTSGSLASNRWSIPGVFKPGMIWKKRLPGAQWKQNYTETTKNTYNFFQEDGF